MDRKEALKERLEKYFSGIRIEEEEVEVGFWLDLFFESGRQHSVNFDRFDKYKIHLNCNHEDGFGSGADKECFTALGVVAFLKKHSK